MPVAENRCDMLKDLRDLMSQYSRLHGGVDRCKFDISLCDLRTLPRQEGQGIVLEACDCASSSRYGLSIRLCRQAFLALVDERRRSIADLCASSVFHRASSRTSGAERGLRCRSFSVDGRCDDESVQ